MTANWKIILTTKKWSRFFENTIVLPQVTETNKLISPRITHLTSNRTTGEIPSFQTKCQNLLKIHFIKKQKHQRKTINLFPLSSETHSLFRTKSWYLHLADCMLRNQILRNERLQTVMLPLSQSQVRKFRSMHLNFLLILCQLEQSETRKRGTIIPRNSLSSQATSFELPWTSFLLSHWTSSKRNDKWTIWS